MLADELSPAGSCGAPSLCLVVAIRRQTSTHGGSLPHLSSYMYYGWICISMFYQVLVFLYIINSGRSGLGFKKENIILYTRGMDLYIYVYIVMHYFFHARATVNNFENRLQLNCK